ncbi:MAG: beta strand repeat-containing protein [Candidatus Acidiferrales bacterium]
MRSRFRLLFLPEIVAAGLLSLAACGGGSSTTNTSPPPPPPTTVIIYPGSPTVPVGEKVDFTAFAPSLPNSTFTWAVTAGSSNGSVNSSTGVFTANATCPSMATVTATSSTNSSLSATATVNITCAQAVTIAPDALAVQAGGVTAFTATAGCNTAAQWYVNGVLGGDTLDGTINSSGNYTAPPTPPPGGVATITAICGNNSGTAAATILFSDDSFSGPYAFSYTGSDGSFLSVAGSYTANGNGGISAGVEDVASLHSGKSAQVTFTGTYTVYFDGSATATLSNGNVWRFDLTANTPAHSGQPVQRALLVRFGSTASDTASGSGTIDQQNSGDFSVAAFFGNYAFNLSGVDLSNNLLQMAGKFNATGAGISIPTGFAVQDINYKSMNTSAAPDDTLQGGFQMDPTYGTTNGRGVVTLTTNSTILNSMGAITTFQYAFYIVDNTHLKVIETTDTAKFLLAGDFYSAPSDDGLFTAAKALPAGNYAFTWSGSGSNGAYIGGGVLDSDGGGSTPSGTTGAFGSGVLDINNAGVKLTLDTSVFGSFTVDPNLGRITLSLTAGANSYTVAAYTASNGSVVLIELDSGVQATGYAYLQSGTTALQQGTYAANLSGLANTNSGAQQQDVLGQIATSDGTVFTGTLSVNDFSTTTITLGEALIPADSTIETPDTNGRGTLTLETSADTFPLAYYVVDNNTVLLLATNSARVATGMIARQF